MKKVLIINGHQYYDVVAKGELTNKIIERATDFFKQNRFDVKYTHIEKGYDIIKFFFRFKDFMMYYIKDIDYKWSVAVTLDIFNARW